MGGARSIRGHVGNQYKRVVTALGVSERLAARTVVSICTTFRDSLGMLGASTRQQLHTLCLSVQRPLEESEWYKSRMLTF
jgi:hypothetical protein